MNTFGHHKKLCVGMRLIKCKNARTGGISSDSVFTIDEIDGSIVKYHYDNLDGDGNHNRFVRGLHEFKLGETVEVVE